MPWSQLGTPTHQYTDCATGNRVVTYKDAIREAIDQAMIDDPRVFAIGLDVDDKFGVFGTMLELTHPERVIGTPVSENAMTGVALGAALAGMRPIYIHLRVDFMMLAMDQIVNYIAKWGHMTRGQVRVPLVIRAVIGRGWGCGAQHSGTLQALFAHIPGLTVVMPSTPYDVKGLFRAAVDSDWPVVFIEHRWLYNTTAPVPEDRYTVPLGRGTLLREGTRMTVVATSLAAHDALHACTQGHLDVDLIDPRTIKPLDEEIILASVAKTGRLLVIDYDFPFCGFAAEVCAMVAEKGFASLRAPVQRMTFPDRSMPASGILERAFYPSVESIRARIEAVLSH